MGKDYFKKLIKDGFYYPGQREERFQNCQQFYGSLLSSRRVSHNQSSISSNQVPKTGTTNSSHYNGYQSRQAQIFDGKKVNRFLQDFDQHYPDEDEEGNVTNATVSGACWDAIAGAT